MGKTKMNKSERIRQLDRAGYTAKQIAAKVGCTPAYVHSVRWASKQEAEKLYAQEAKKILSTGINASAPPPAPTFTSITAVPVKRPRGRPRKVQNTFTTPVIRVGEATLEYHPARLSLRQRIKVLFTGKV